MPPKIKPTKDRAVDAELYAQEAAACQPAIGHGHVDNLHAQIAHVVPRSIVELVAHVVEVGGVTADDLIAKDRRLASQLVRSGYLAPARAGRIVATADGAKLVGAFVAAGWIR